MIEVKFDWAELARLQALDLAAAIKDEGLRLEVERQLELAGRNDPARTKLLSARLSRSGAAALSALLGRRPPKELPDSSRPKPQGSSPAAETSAMWLSFSGNQADRIRSALLAAGDLPETELQRGPYRADPELVARAHAQWLRRNRYPAQAVAWRARRDQLDPDVIDLLERLAIA